MPSLDPAPKRAPLYEGRNLPIKGHSGCEIAYGKDTIVKFTSVRQWGTRLMRSADTQTLHRDPEVRAPKVIKTIVGPPQWSLTQERIKGEILTDSPYRYLCMEKLIRYVARSFDASTTVHVGPRVFIRKLEQIAAAVDRFDRYAVPHRRIVHEKIVQLRDHFGPGIELPVGPMHGDLTLCNVLCRGNDVFVFDFLDGIVSSPVMDVVKLRQDTLHGWITLWATVPPGMLQDLDHQILTTFGYYPSVRAHGAAFMLLTLLRILPYATEPRVIRFLLREIQTCQL